MILVDTSVWVDHLRQGEVELQNLLNVGQVLTYPFVIEELALGNLQKRGVILDALQDLPQTSVATDEEVLHLIDRESFYGIGIGYIDSHLLAAVRLTPGSMLWTRDKHLLIAATRLGLSASMARQRV